MDLVQQIAGISAFEWIAAIFGVLSVWFARINSIWVFPLGLISVGLYALICFQFGLYADAGVNIYYFLMSIYGWYFWVKGGKSQASENYREAEVIDKVGQEVSPEKTTEEAQISTNSFQQNVIYLLSAVFIWLILAYVLIQYTNSTVPWMDAATTSIFIVAMYAMAKRKIEHWIFWILGDAISIPLYIAKGLHITAVQYGIFLVIAIWGFAVWFKKLENYYLIHETNRPNGT